MKRLLLVAFLMIQAGLFAQKDCDFESNFTDSIGTYKETRQKIMYEKNFGGNSQYIFFSLASENGVPLLNFQSIQKSKDFMKATCFNQASKIYIQLENSKIITLVMSEEGNCGSTVRDEKSGANVRVTSASFYFMRNAFEELKKSNVNLIRIKYATETVDYIIKKEIVSELDTKTYTPQNFFMDYLKCVE